MSSDCPAAVAKSPCRLMSWRATSDPTTPRPAIAIFKPDFAFVITNSLFHKFSFLPAISGFAMV
jgi:hypothetical protein